MKILHVITSLGSSGAERLMVDLLPNLKKMGDDVELLLFNGMRVPADQFEVLEAAGITIHHFSEDWNLRNPTHIYKLTKIIGKYDIVHSHNSTCQLYTALASLVTPVTLCTTEHSAYNRRRGKWWFKPIDKWMYSRYSKIICVGEQVKKNLCDYLDSYDDKFITVYNGIDLKRFEDVVPLKRKDLGIEDDKFIITMVSLFRPPKDQDTLIRSMKILPDKYHLVLVGGGERQSTLESLTKSLGVEEKVSFVGVRADVPEILQTVDVVVQSSHWEGLSLSSVEAMASGRPIIASDVDGLREVVKGAGLLFEHGNHEQLAARIRELCENPEYYNMIALQCRQRAQCYSIDAMAQGYHNVYMKLMNDN